MRDSLPELGWFLLPPANVGERPRTGPVDCLCLIIAGVPDMQAQPPPDATSRSWSKAPFQRPATRPAFHRASVEHDPHSSAADRRNTTPFHRREGWNPTRSPPPRSGGRIKPGASAPGESIEKASSGGAKGPANGMSLPRSGGRIEPGASAPGESREEASSGGAKEPAGGMSPPRSGGRIEPGASAPGWKQRKSKLRRSERAGWRSGPIKWRI